MVFKKPPIYCHCWVEAYFFPPGRHPYGPSIDRHNQVEESERPDAPEIGSTNQPTPITFTPPPEIAGVPYDQGFKKNPWFP